MFLTLPNVVMTARWCPLNVVCTLQMVLRELEMVLTVVCRETPPMPEATRFRSPDVVPVMLMGVTT